MPFHQSDNPSTDVSHTVCHILLSRSLFIQTSLKTIIVNRVSGHARHHTPAAEACHNIQKSYLLPLDLVKKIADILITEDESLKGFRLVHSRFNFAVLMTGLRVLINGSDFIRNRWCFGDGNYCHCFTHMMDWNTEAFNNLIKSNNLGDIVTLSVEMPYEDITTDLELAQKARSLTKATGEASRLKRLCVHLVTLYNERGWTESEQKRVKELFKEMEEICDQQNIVTTVARKGWTLKEFIMDREVYELAHDEDFWDC